MKRYENVLVGIHYFDPSDEPGDERLADDSEEAVRCALLLAAAQQARVTFAHVFRAGESQRQLIEEGKGHEGSLLDSSQRILDGLVQRAAAAGVQASAEHLWGRPSQEVARRAKSGGFDLVVIGDRKHAALRRALLGTTATKLMHHCSVPLWIVRRQPAACVEQVLIATDLSDVGQQAVEQGLLMAQWSKCRITIVHAVENWFADRMHRVKYAREAILREHEEQKEKASLALNEQVMAAVRGLSLAAIPDVRVDSGKPDEVIWRLVQERRIDLLVMGLRKHGGLEGLVLGGTAQRLLPEVGCSLLIVKAPGFSSPEL